MGLRRPRRGVRKQVGGLIIGGCSFIAGGLGLAGARRAGTSASALCSGAGGVMIGSLISGVGGAELVWGVWSVISRFGRFGCMRW